MCDQCDVPTVHRSIYKDQGLPVELGSVIAERYKVESVIGRGGQAVVYRAKQVGMNRTVAIKCLDGELSSRPKQIKRFYRETQAAGKLEHPNVIRIFDFGIDTATRLPFYVMEFLDGRTLAEAIREDGPMSEQRAANLSSQVARALVAAHDRGIIHRDLKPQNITIQVLPDGEELLKVLDFGIAKVLQEDESEGLTSTGDTLGTPLYMSPEQVRGGDIDFRTDLYALGCILFQMMSGHPPYEARDAYALIVKHLRHEPPPLPNPLSDGAPPSQTIQRLVRRLLEKEPKQRPPSTSAVTSLLRTIALQTAPTESPEWLLTNPAMEETDGSSQLQFFPPTASGDDADTENDAIQDLSVTPDTVLDRPVSDPPSNPGAAKTINQPVMEPSLLATREGPATHLQQTATPTGRMQTTAMWTLAVALLIGSSWLAVEMFTKGDLTLTANKSNSGTHSSGQGSSANETERSPQNNRRPGTTTPTQSPPRALQTPSTSLPTSRGPIAKTRIESKPTGAFLYIDGEFSGKTPTVIRRNAVETGTSFVLKRKGYFSLNLSLSELESGSVFVELTRVKPSHKPHSKKRNRKRSKPGAVPVWD